MNIIVAVFVLLFISYTLSQELLTSAYCDFDEFDFGLVSGHVSIHEYVDLDIGVIFVFNINSSALSADVNNIHIHQTGINAFGDGTCGATVTGGHYNPVLNYGELTGIVGSVTAEDAPKFQFGITGISLSGEHGFLGRAIVIHKNDGARIGCCNVAFESGTLPSYKDQIPEPSPVGECAFFNLVQDGEFFVNVTADGDYVSFAVYDSCAQSDANQPIATPQIDVVGDTRLEVTLVGANSVAGKRILYYDNFASVSCCTIVLKNFQPNVNDVYVKPTSDSSTSGSSTSDSSTSEGSDVSITEGSITEGSITDGSDVSITDGSDVSITDGSDVSITGDSTVVENSSHDESTQDDTNSDSAGQFVLSLMIGAVLSLQ